MEISLFNVLNDKVITELMWGKKKRKGILMNYLLRPTELVSYTRAVFTGRSVQNLI